MKKIVDGKYVELTPKEIDEKRKIDAASSKQDDEKRKKKEEAKIEESKLVIEVMKKLELSDEEWQILCESIRKKR